jgi:phosphate uptake regulator
MKRKVVRHGSNTLTISLPAKWAKKNDVEPGDEIELIDKQNSLIILPKNKVKHEKKLIDITNMDKRIADYAMTNVYSEGFDEVEIIYDNKEVISHIKKILQETLIGYEIFYLSDKRCILRNISTPQSSEFESIMRKNFQVVTLLADESLKYIEKKEYGSMAELITLERTNNKFTNFLLRVVCTEGVRSRKADFNLYIMIRLLERVADTYRDVCVHLSEQDPKDIKISKDTIEIYKVMNRVVKEYSELYFSYDHNKANKLSVLWQDLLKKSYIVKSHSKNIHEIRVINCLVRISHELDSMLHQLVGLII